MHKIINLLSVVIFWTFAVAQQSPCTNYYDQPGSCVPITSCQSLLDLESNPNRTFHDLLILDGSYCGPSSGIRWVCCDSGVISTTPRSPFNIVTPINNPTRSKRSNNHQKKRKKLLPEPDNDECGLHFPDKIFGGTSVELDEHPWTALLGYTLENNSTVFGCAGSIINDRYVLTAAHCITSGNHPTFVRLGEWNVATVNDCIGTRCNDPPVDAKIDPDGIILHPGYNPSDRNRYDDIALLRLAHKITFSLTIKPICLPLTPELNPRNDHHLQRYTIVGWGITENYTKSDVKLQVELPGVSLDDCNRVYQKIRTPITLRETQMCAGGEKGAGSCSGDSGGPLLGVYSPGRGIHYNYLAGVISFGIGNCGKKKWPGVLTNVATYISWIQDNVKE